MANNGTGAWQEIPGGATDIGVGAGQIWTIGGSGVPHYWESFAPPNPVPGDWPVAPPNDLQGATRIAVGPGGLPWVVLQDFRIMRRAGS
jgi:hypothetical protein